MTYEEARQYIREAGRSGMMPGLVRMRVLLGHLGDPQDQLQFIHIAGTNGKGSVAAYISSILAASGHLVGRFVSPPVFEYEECIQCEDAAGVCHIDRELLAQVVTETAAAVEVMRQAGEEVPTVFEIETAMAFLAFVHWSCDIVVLEAGLGGREDATNIISCENKIASVITPVAPDHQAVLGNTIQEIAAAKAGIIRDRGVVITCQEDPAALAVIREEARKREASLYEVERADITVLAADLTGSVFAYKKEHYRTVMAGLYQPGNAALAIETCCRLPESFHLTGGALTTGIRRAVWRGRFEVVCSSPLIILDGAHNPAGAEALRDTAEKLLCGKRLHGVTGVLRDKDYGTMAGILAPLFADVVTVTPPGERGLDREILADVWRRRGCGQVSTADMVMTGLKRAMEECVEGDAILIFGSLSFFRELDWNADR